MAVNKQSFFEGINQGTVFDEAFFKKVLGYSLHDKPFLEVVAAKLTSIGRGDAVQAYNVWYAAWKTNDDVEMKKVAEWFHKECDREFEKRRKEHEKVMDDWERKKIQLLTRKKQLLNSLKSTDS